jgi:hypothetical protein
VSRRRSGLRFAIATALALVPATAHADGEAWFWVENRIPIVRRPVPGDFRVDWRVVTDIRIANRHGGISQAFLRTGPLVFPTRFLFVALQGTIYSDRLASGRHDQEARLELEPNFFGRVGDFTFNDRNRVEFRWRETEERWRYRNQLRVNYAPIGEKWIPFMWNEVLCDLSGLGVNQNRFEVGLGRMLNPSTRLDVGYMIRSREDPAGNWAHDHILNLYLFLDVVPPPSP